MQSTESKPPSAKSLLFGFSLLELLLVHALDRETLETVEALVRLELQHQRRFVQHVALVRDERVEAVDKPLLDEEQVAHIQRTVDDKIAYLQQLTKIETHSAVSGYAAYREQRRR